MGEEKMGVYRRKGSKFWFIRFEHNGRSIQESSRTTAKKQALLVEAELKLKYFPQMASGDGKISTLGEFTNQLYPFWTGELRPNTRKFYKGCVQRSAAVR